MCVCVCANNVSSSRSRARWKFLLHESHHSKTNANDRGYSSRSIVLVHMSRSSIREFTTFAQTPQNDRERRQFGVHRYSARGETLKHFDAITLLRIYGSLKCSQAYRRYSSDFPLYAKFPPAPRASRDPIFLRQQNVISHAERNFFFRAQNGKSLVLAHELAHILSPNSASAIAHRIYR